MADAAKPKRLGAKRKLNRPEIVRAAIALIEAEGLSALSSRKLAAALGCEAMSLYHHYRNMDSLLDAVVDELLAGQAIPFATGNPQNSEIAAAALSYLSIAAAYPRAFELVATRRWRTPNALAAVQSLVGAFAACGVSPDQALGKARILAAYLNGAGLALSAWLKASNETLPLVQAALPEIQSTTLEASGVRDDLISGVGLLIEKLTSGS